MDLKSSTLSFAFHSTWLYSFLFARKDDNKKNTVGKLTTDKWIVSAQSALSSMKHVLSGILFEALRANKVLNFRSDFPSASKSTKYDIIYCTFFPPQFSPEQTESIKSNQSSGSISFK